MKKVGILLKVFSSEKYKEDFLNGNLYMNTIDYFRRYEEDTKGNIADVNEALTGWFQPHEFKFEIEVNGVKHTLNPDDMVGPITTRMNMHDHANVFCMTHLHSHDIDMGNIKSEEEEALVKDYFSLPKDVENLGEHLVIITDPRAFVRRAIEAAKKLCEDGIAISYSSKQVIYYDEASKSLLLKSDSDAPFYKQSMYAHQNEYRLCLMRQNPESKPFTMHIGDLRDISMEARTSEFNSMIELRKV